LLLRLWAGFLARGLQRHAAGNKLNRSIKGSGTLAPPLWAAI
jgi:hypothetical protein